MKLYEMVMERAKYFIFFTKWNGIIPIIEKSNDFNMIFLILTESYLSGSTYTFKIFFYRGSNEIEMISDGINLLKK